jgi:soluble lytic murein transglycosylase-like protein
VPNRSRLRLVAAPVAAALALTLAPVAAADDLSSAARDLADARDGLDEAQQAIADINDEIADTNSRLGDANTDLADVTDQHQQAEAAAEQAEADHEQAVTDYHDANTRLNQHLRELAGFQELFDTRAVTAYKHGRAGNAELLMQGVTSSADWHDVSLTVEAVSRILDNDRQVTAEAAAVAADAQTARDQASRARTDAARAARDAAEQRRHAAQLVERQKQLVAEIEADLDKRKKALRRLERDEDLAAGLVDEMERRVGQIEAIRLAWEADQASTSTSGDLPDYDASVAPDWANRLPASGRRWAPAMEQAAARHNIDPRLLAAVVWTESNFRPDVVSHAGAIGLSQLMPGTARGLGVDPWDPIQNLDGGARYIRQMLDMFGTVELAMAGYNAGPGNVRRYGGVPPFAETQAYVVRIAERYASLSQ